MNNTATIDYNTDTFNHDYLKCESLENRTTLHNKFHQLALAGAIASLMIPSTTVLNDSWMMEKISRDSVVTVSTSSTILRKSVSRKEALKLSRKILESAENERRIIAENEAISGYQW